MNVPRSIATGIGSVGVRVVHGLTELLGKSHGVAMELLGEVGTKSGTIGTVGEISTTKVLDNFHGVLDLGLFECFFREKVDAISKGNRAKQKHACIQKCMHR